MPDDVAVVGFDGTPLSAYTDPPLTTVRQPIYDIGREVAELLLRVIAHPDTESHGELIQPTLVIRGSSGRNFRATGGGPSGSTRAQNV